ncbi:MAG: 4-(cytidine 5'-diphospho)-2-C-methyl-D-erythritol kinase [Chloroflexi bacterium]|nr:4-(cytidine 5'-diphospho)-2-C-methyl-D-erythritol kinase [Chloroflexota bacterium]
MQAPIMLKAYAKVNLTLEVLGRREDGYHEVVTLLQTVSLHDQLSVRPAPGLGIQCDDPTLEGPDNLAFRAALLLQGKYAPGRGVAIGIKKGIPVAGGLGGGSTDAAATLVALDRLWGLDLGMARLLDAAAALGSDVPFFIRGGTAVARGRGEVVETLRPAPPFWMVLVCPPVRPANKTASLYRLLGPGHYTRGEATETVLERLKAGRPFEPDQFCNVFEAVADGVFPELAGYRRALEEVSGHRAHLSGTGPSLFALVPDRAAAERAAGALWARGLAAWAVSSVNGGPA